MVGVAIERCAVIRCGSMHWQLEPGQELTFGRGENCDIRIGHDPEDRHVSRAAGALIGIDDTVLVRNDSLTQPLMVQTFPGPEFTLEPRAMASSPHKYLRVVVPGNWGTQYSLAIDASPLRSEADATEGAADFDQAPIVALVPTHVGDPTLSARELQLLAALCEPLLLYAGSAAVPATYREIGTRLNLSTAYVRNRLDAIRARLSDQGVPGLRGNDHDDRSKNSYSAELARWAVRTGTVNSDIIRQLPPDGPE